MKCPTCGKLFGTTIYQCSTGHSACETCKKYNKSCGQCMKPLTDIKNYSLQEYIAGLNLKDPQPNRKTINKNPGATAAEPKKDVSIACPLGVHDQKCKWKGTLAELSDHFTAAHPDTLKATVDQELVLRPTLLEHLNIDSYKSINFIDLGAHKFLTFLTVDKSGTTGTVSMTVQMLANAKLASQWFFELQMYDKGEPNRKITFRDRCRSINVPLKAIDEEATCVIPLSLARTFFNERIDGMNYKFYIKRVFHQPKKLPPKIKQEQRRPNTNPGSEAAAATGTTQLL